MMAALIFIFAFLVRLASLFSAGGFDAVLGYDDGVYYGATTAFIHGLVPYKDFVMVHPPGILLVLTPFAWIAQHTSDSMGFYLARLFFMLVGSASAVLIYRVGRRFNRTAGIIGALVYSVWMPVVRIERTPYLEGIGSLALLLALYLLPTVRTKLVRVVIAGAGLGFAVSTKLWFAIPVAVITLWFLLSREFKRAIIFGTSAVAIFLAVITPFWIRSGNEIWKLIITAQLNRESGPIEGASRIEQIFNFASLSFIKSYEVRTVLGILFIGLVIFEFLKHFRKREQGLLILLLFIAQVLVLMKTPVFFNAYPSFAAATFALIAGISLGVYHRNLLTGALILGLVGVGIWGTLTQEIGRDLPTKIEQLSLQKSQCVTSDSPALLALTNTLSRNIDNKCNLILDVTGTIYGIDNGANPYHRSATSRRLRSAQYQRELEKYLSSGSTIILARERQDGLRPETYKSIYEGHKVTRTHDFVIITK